MLKYSDTVSSPSGLAAFQLNVGHVGAAMTLEAPSNETNNVEAYILINFRPMIYEEEYRILVCSRINVVSFLESQSSLGRNMRRLIRNRKPKENRPR